MANAALGAVLGAVLGSFAATVLIRWPQGRTVAHGRSRCDGCGAALRAHELVPLLSYVLQRGRCRRCASPIDRRHPLVELGAAAIGAIAFALHEPILAFIGTLLGCWLLLVACLDFEHHWLPDTLTLPLIPAGLALGLTALPPSFGDRLIGASAGGAVLWLLGWAYHRLRGRRGLGGGDPKLLAGLGAWLGWAPLPFVLTGAALIGLGAALLMTARGRHVGAATPLPLGTMMAAAAWPIWIAGPAFLPV